MSVVDRVLAGQARALELLVRGRPLREVLDAIEAVATGEVGAPVTLQVGAASGERVPIRAAAREIGAFLVGGAPPDADAAREILERLAQTAALAIEHTGRARFLSDLDASVQALADPAAMMRTTARILATYLDVERCAYAEIEDGRVFVITGDHTRGVPSIVGRWDVAAFGAACVAAMRAGVPFVVEDASTDPRISADDLAAYRATNIAGVICVPLHKRGVFTAAMAVHTVAPRAWTLEEVDLVDTVVARCWEALERGRATAAQAASDARLDYATRLSGIGFWYCDLPFDELVWDERVKRHFFFALDERITIEKFYDRIHAADRDATREAIDASIRDHTAYDIVYRTVDPESGAVKAIRALGGTAYDEAGNPTHFDGVTVDVTEQKLAEDRLAGVARAALTIHSASSLESVLRVVTEEARSLIGARTAMTRVFGGAEVRVGDVTVPVDDTVLRELGRPRRVAGSHGLLAVPFVGRTGARLGAMVLAEPIAGELTHADESIAIQLAQLAVVAIENVQLYDRLRDQDRRKDEFLATLAHELRNPLAPVRTGLDLLGIDPSPERVVRTRAMMDRQLGHLVRLVDDLLDISRVTLGKVSLKRERVDLRTVIDSAIETTRSLVEAGKHELTVELPAAPLPLEVDPTRLSQVFANLVNNAAKYTPKGGKISVTAERRGDVLDVRVRDTGVGIPEDMLPLVFDMFTQVGRTIDRSQGGLGIGLTLVRRLVEMHGGAVTAQSEGAGQGSTFVVTIPVAADARSGESGRFAAAIVPEAARALRILVVDDNIDAAETLAAVLQLRGHETRLAHTGPDALTVAAAFAPEIIFLDIGLPGLNGYEVARRLRAAGEPQPWIVALTGWGTDEDRRQAREAGFDQHLVKPVDAAQLDSVLAESRDRR